MADTQNIPDILINNRRGWIAESDSLMREWDCAYMHNLDGRSEPSCLKLNWEVRKPVYNTWSWLWIAIIDSYVWCDNWEVYVLWWWLQYTAPWQILWVTKFLIKDPTYRRVYLCFYRVWANILSLVVPILPNGTAVWWSVVTWYWLVYDTITNTTIPFSVATTNDSIYIINYEDYFLYFSVWDSVYVMNQEFTTAVNGRMELYLKLESDVKWLTRSWYTINIYLYNWLKYFRQWVWNTITSWSIDLWAKRIQWVWEWKNFDYIVGVWFTGQSNCLFVSQWQDIQLLKEWNFVIDWFNVLSKFYIESTTTNKYRTAHNHNLAFFPIVWDQWLWVVSLGTRNEITSKAWINEYIDWDLEEIWAIVFWWDANLSPTLYICVKEWGVWRVYNMDFTRKSSWQKYQESWVWYTKKYLSPNVKQRTATRYRFRYDLPANTSINISYSVDWEDTYTPLWSIWWLPIQKDYEWLTIDWATKPRYEIQFKIEMATTNTDNTPKLYTMEVYGSNTTR